MIDILDILDIYGHCRRNRASTQPATPARLKHFLAAITRERRSFFKLITPRHFAALWRIDTEPGRRSRNRARSLRDTRAPFGLIERYYIAACRRHDARDTQSL